jgi:L-fucose isomerase
VRTYWSPEAVKRVASHQLSGRAAGGIIHLINSGAATLDATGWEEIDGKPAIKPWWEVTPAERQKCLEATIWFPARLEYFRGGGFSSQFLTRGEMPVTMCRLNLVAGLGPALQIAEGWTVDLPKVYPPQRAHHPTWPSHWFVRT